MGVSNHLLNGMIPQVGPASFVFFLGGPCFRRPRQFHAAVQSGNQDVAAWRALSRTAVQSLRHFKVPGVYILGVSKNRCTRKSSILIGFSMINHPFWGFSPHFWKHPYTQCGCFCSGWVVYLADEGGVVRV